MIDDTVSQIRHESDSKAQNKERERRKTNDINIGKAY